MHKPTALTPSPARSAAPRADRRTLAPLATALGLFALAWFLLAQERERVGATARAGVELAAEQAASRLSIWIEDRLGVLARFARERGRPEAASDEAFRAEARLLIDRVRGFRALNWIDEDGRIRIVVPEFGNEGALGSSLRDHAHPGVRAAVDRSLSTLLPSRTPLVPLLQGGMGFSVYWPVQAPGDTHGSIVNGVFDLPAVLAQALPELLEDEDHAFRIENEAGDVLFTSGAFGTNVDPLEATQIVPFADRPLRLRVRPTKPPGATLLGSSYALALSLAAVISVLAALALRAMLHRAGAIAEAESYKRLLLDSTSDGLLGLDLLGRCTFCNSAALSLLGLERTEELVGRGGLSWIVDESEAGAPLPSVEIFGALREGRTFTAAQLRARRADGTQRTVSVRCHPVRERGQLTGALVSLADVTREVRESDRAHRLMTVLLRVPEVVALIDPGGQLAFLNPAARTVLGIGEEAVSALSFRDLVHRDGVRRILAEVLPTMNDRDLWQGEVELLARDGERIPSQMVVMRHVDHQDAVYFSVIARDLRDERRAAAEREALEIQFREAQRTESLGLLAGSIAHDFNNMLMGVLGNASLALELLDRDSPAHHHVCRVQTATEHAAELVGQLLAYSGRGRFEAATVDAGRIVTELTTLLRTTIPKRVELDVTAQRAGIVADPTQLRQLVMNLVTNAADAIGATATGSGTVRVTVDHTTLDGTCRPSHDFGQGDATRDWIRIRVADDGCGMPAAVMDQIFDPFFTTRDEGKGLGLAAVLGIVRGHAGMLDLRSVEGEGTCFTLYFPPSADPIEDDDAATASEGAATQLRGTVLLVDDESGVRDYLTAALEAMGLQVECCEDGDAGVARFSELHDQLQLVLMDQSMPGLSGDAAWRAMRAIDDAVPAVLMSGYDEVRIDGSVQALGFSGFLHKPFRFDELRDAVLQAIGEADAVDVVA